MYDTNRKWYKDIAVYQIWIRSFCDGNGDGIGDLQGVLSKLDYIKSLGVDAIWFSPIYKSPQEDFGYDISDYRDIQPEYGTLDDFRKVVDGAHERGIKIIMDLVVNHTSTEHYWFQQSRKGGDDNPYKDYYIWRPGKNGGKRPPNNWQSTFGGDGWEWDDVRKEYYLHLFAIHQADLNMDNPAVREEVKGILRFWLDFGVDGFREDVITFISKANLKNGFPLPIATGIEHYARGPHLHEYLQEFYDDVLSKYDCMTVGEGPGLNAKNCLDLIGEKPGHVLDMIFHFEHMSADGLFTSWIPRPFDLKKLKGVFTKWQKSLYGRGWNSLYIENHDQPRVVSRYGDDKVYRVESAKALATMYLCQCGTPYIYQGQEIGMTNIPFDSIDEYIDVQTHNIAAIMRKLHFPEKKIVAAANAASRDNARTPVQWTAGKNAGFTDADKPWFTVNPNYTTVNVEAAEKDPNSVLNYYRALLALRKGSELMRYGAYEEYYHENSSLYCYGRMYEGKRALVVISFAKEPMAFRAPEGYELSEGRLALCSYNGRANAAGNAFTLRPYESRVYIWD
ncbi:MAG: alpha-glucosidase [Clostridia bacterium]|nr:alpha-glucosidase [Clostridia bacterium]